MNPQRLLTEAAAVTSDAHRRGLRPWRNLDEVQPGFPSTTPANGSPGGGKGARMTEIRADSGEILDRIPVTSVEAVVLDGGLHHDRAYQDLRRARTLTAIVYRAGRELDDILARWDYPVAGELGDPRTGKPTESDTNAQRWCASCTRLRRAEPVHRGDLCRWCGDFTAAEGQWPTVELLDAHHRGVRITTAMVAKTRKPTVTKRRIKHRATK